MLDGPNDYYTPTRRETITWVAAALFTLTGRFIARQLTTRRPVWAVLAVTVTPAIAYSIAFGATDKQSLTLGPSRVEAASEDAQPFGVAEASPTPTADARLQSGYVTPVPNATDAPAAERASGPAGEPLPAWLPPTVARWEANIRSAAGRYGVDPALLAIIVTVESGGDPRAGSPAGAVGLAQVVARYHPRLNDGDPYDPDHNLDVGAEYLAECLRTYAVAGDEANDWQATVERAGMAYNGGGGGVANPNAETRAYRRWIGGLWRERHDATSPTLDAWIAAGGGVALDIAATVDGPPTDAPAAGPAPFEFTPRVAPGAPDHLEVANGGR